MVLVRKPPGDFTQTPDVVAIPTGTTFLRLSHRRHSSSLYYGRASRYRWDAPDGQFGVLYVGTTFEVCVAETVARPAPDAPLDAATGVKILSEAGDLRPYDVYRITAHRPLMLAAMYGATFQRLGIDSAVLAARDYASSQAWARWLHDHPMNFHGIQYVSRLLGNAYNIALFDRSSDCLREEKLGALVDYRDVATHADIYTLLEAFDWFVDD